MMQAMQGVSNCIYNKKITNSEDYFHQEADEGFETMAIHDGQSPDQWELGTIVPPIHTGSTFKQNDPENPGKYTYGRIGNPSRKFLEICFASLDNAKYGLALSSGMGAIAGVGELLGFGDHVICGNDVFGGCREYFLKTAKNHGLEVDFVDTSVIEKVKEAFKPNTKMVFVESLTNPFLKVMDIPRLAEAIKSKCHEAILVVDNTFLSPYLQKPLLMGADIVVYSLTKYMNGHSDVIMGAITTNDEHLYKKLAKIQNIIGLIPSPFDCYLVNRSLKTLSLRMDRHIKNATKIAKFLEQHPLVEKVIYPGLESHPQYNLAKQLLRGTSGMISMYIKGDMKTSLVFLKALRIFSIAMSLGGFESLVILPNFSPSSNVHRDMTHNSLSAEMKKELHITDNLIRLSVGLETAADLIKDLDQALKVAAMYYVPS